MVYVKILQLNVYVFSVLKLNYVLFTGKLNMIWHRLADL